MKNIDILAQHITKYGTKDIFVHAILGTKNWIVCQILAPNKWLIILMDPMGNVTYNLGIVNNVQLETLWKEIIRWELETRVSQILLAEELKKKIQNFKKYYARNYKKFTKFRERRKKKNRIKK